MFDGQQNTEFSDGAMSAKYPEFQTAQQIKSSVFRPNSVLNPIGVSGSGLSSSDQNRRLYGGGMLPTANGASSDTATKRTMLDSPYKTL
jgi:hypothetical protein